MSNAIEVENLTKYYGNLLAIDYVTFQVHPGEVFGFLGPNGAGKTTTIRMLTGLTRPTMGYARVLGLDVASDLARMKKRIGGVPEVSNLYDELSASLSLLSWPLPSTTRAMCAH
ncbi:MAG: ATP-binding cassette domain-containing protein [Anaerolineae bacterium]